MKLSSGLGGVDWVRLCVSCSLQGSCLHADSHLFAMQKQRRAQRSVHVLQSVGDAGKCENDKRAEAEGGWK